MGNVTEVFLVHNPDANIFKRPSVKLKFDEDEVTRYNYGSSTISRVGSQQLDYKTGLVEGASRQEYSSTSTSDLEGAYLFASFMENNFSLAYDMSFAGEHPALNGGYLNIFPLLAQACQVVFVKGTLVPYL